MQPWKALILCAGLFVMLLLSVQPATADLSASGTVLSDGFSAQTQTSNDSGSVRPDLLRDRAERRPGGFGLQVIPIILVIPLVWLLMRGMRGRNDEFEDRHYGSNDQGQGGHPDDDPEHLKDAYAAARARWGYMAGEGQSDSKKPVQHEHGFNETEFLDGARLAYVRLTEAFDAHDVEGAAPFASDAILEGLQSRKNSGVQTTHTEIVLVEAELLEHQQDQGREEAAVLYDVLLRRGPDAPEPEQVRQVWRFVRATGPGAGNWKLDRMDSPTEYHPE